MLSYICVPKETLSKYKLDLKLCCVTSIAWIIIPLQESAEPECTQFENILTDCLTQTLCCIILCEGNAEQGGLTSRRAPAHPNYVSAVSPVTF